MKKYLFFFFLVASCFGQATNDGYTGVRDAAGRSIIANQGVTEIDAALVEFDNAGTDYTATSAQGALVEVDDWLLGNTVFPSALNIQSHGLSLTAATGNLTLLGSGSGELSLLSTDQVRLENSLSHIDFSPAGLATIASTQFIANYDDDYFGMGQGAYELLNPDTVGIIMGVGGFPGTPFQGVFCADTGSYGQAGIYNLAASIFADDTNGSIAMTDLAGSYLKLYGDGDYSLSASDTTGFYFYGDGAGSTDEMTYVDKNNNNFDFNSSGMFIYNTHAGYGLFMDYGGQTGFHLVGDGTYYLSAPVTGSGRVNAGGTTQVMSSGVYRVTTVAGMKFELNDSDDAYEFNPADGSTTVDMGSMFVESVKDPVTSQQAATKNYVDGLVPSGAFGFAVTFSNALTTPVTQVIPGVSSTSFIAFGERGTAIASSFGWTSPGPNTIIFNGTFAGAATITGVGLK